MGRRERSLAIDRRGRRDFSREVRLFWIDPKMGTQALTREREGTERKIFIPRFVSNPPGGARRRMESIVRVNVRSTMN